MGLPSLTITQLEACTTLPTRRPPGSTAPGKATGTRWPTAMLVAPHTISSGSPGPVVTRVSESRSARGCFSTASSSPTTTFAQSLPRRSMPLTSMPSIVRRAASSSGASSTSTSSRSHDSGTLIGGSSSELAQEAQVVLEEEAQVVDPVPEHRDALRAHPEGEALVALRIEAAVAQHDRVDHARAEDRHPAAPAAGRAADAAAHQALDVEGDGRLGERVVAGAESGPLARA